MIGVYVWQPEHLTRTFLRVAFSRHARRPRPAPPARPRHPAHALAGPRPIARRADRACAARWSCAASTIISRGARYPLELLVAPAAGSPVRPLRWPPAADPRPDRGARARRIIPRMRSSASFSPSRAASIPPCPPCCCSGRATTCTRCSCATGTRTKTATARPPPTCRTRAGSARTCASRCIPSASPLNTASGLRALSRRTGTPAARPTRTSPATAKSSSASVSRTRCASARTCSPPATTRGLVEAACCAGIDPGKDQTYFLHSVPGAMLARTLFPIGDLPKSEVRRIAHARGLAVHDKRDSTGICFIGERPFAEFLANLPACPARADRNSGRSSARDAPRAHVLHARPAPGARSWAACAALRKSHGTWRAKDLERNVLVVVQEHDHPLLLADEIATEVGALDRRGAATGPDSAHASRCTVKLRYRQADQRCTVEVLRRRPLCRAHDHGPTSRDAWAVGGVLRAVTACLGGA